MFEIMYVTAIVQSMIIALCGLGVLVLAIHLDDKKNKKMGMKTILP